VHWLPPRDRERTVGRVQELAEQLGLRRLPAGGETSADPRDSITASGGAP
jgi:hypothetical protein